MLSVSFYNSRQFSIYATFFVTLYVIKRTRTQRVCALNDYDTIRVYLAGTVYVQYSAFGKSLCTYKRFGNLEVMSTAIQG